MKYTLINVILCYQKRIYNFMKEKEMEINKKAIRN